MSPHTVWDRSLLAFAALAATASFGIASNAQETNGTVPEMAVISTEEASHLTADFTLATRGLVAQRLSAPQLTLEERIAALNHTATVKPDYHTTFADTEAEALRTLPIYIVDSEETVVDEPLVMLEE